MKRKTGRHTNTKKENILNYVSGKNRISFSLLLSKKSNHKSKMWFFLLLHHNNRKRAMKKAQEKIKFGDIKKSNGIVLLKTTH